MSQADGKKQSIDGVEYAVYHLAPTPSRKLLKRLLDAILPAVGGIVGSLKGSEGSGLLNAKLDGSLLSANLTQLLDRLDEKLMDDLVAAFSKVTLADGKPLGEIFEAHFRGKVGQMFEWLAFCLRAEYEDTLKKTLGGIAPGGLAAAQAFLSQATSPTSGPSGGS